MENIMGKTKSKPKPVNAPKVKPVAPEVQKQDSYKPSMNTGRRAQSILSPDQAMKQEEKDILG